MSEFDMAGINAELFLSRFPDISPIMMEVRDFGFIEELSAIHGAWAVRIHGSRYELDIGCNHRESGLFTISYTRESKYGDRRSVGEA